MHYVLTSSEKFRSCLMEGKLLEIIIIDERRQTRKEREREQYNRKSDNLEIEF